jgi:hypothetical protein
MVFAFLALVAWAPTSVAADPPGGKPAQEQPVAATEHPAPTDITDATGPVDATGPADAASKFDLADTANANGSKTGPSDPEVDRQRQERREKARGGFRWLLAIILIGLALVIFAMLYGVFLRQRSRQPLAPAPGEEFLEELRAARVKAEAAGGKASETTVDRSTLAMTPVQIHGDSGDGGSGDNTPGDGHSGPGDSGDGSPGENRPGENRPGAPEAGP